MNQPEFSLGTKTAATDLTGKARRFVKLDSNTQINVCGNNESGIGVLQDEPLAGKPGNIMIVGLTEIVTGGAFGVMSTLRSDAQGRAVAASNTDQFIFGVALEASTGAGQIITMILFGANVARESQGVVQLALRVPAFAANTDGTLAAFRPAFDFTVTSLTYIPDTVLTGANTDSRTLKLINKGQAGAGSTEVASKAFTSGVNAPAFDETAITLSGTTANLDGSAGDVLAWNSDSIGGSGLADPGGLIVLTIQRR